MKATVAKWMRRFADRIDDAGAPKAISWSFTIERGKGMVFHEDGVISPRSAMKGCPLWIIKDEDYPLAFKNWV